MQMAGSSEIVKLSLMDQLKCSKLSSTVWGRLRQPTCFHRPMHLLHCECSWAHNETNNPNVALL